MARMFHRFLAAGLDAAPRRMSLGRARTVTAEWETEVLAEYLGKQIGIQVTEETVRVYLHAHGYVCKRPTWTSQRKAEEQADYVGKDCG